MVSVIFNLATCVRAEHGQSMINIL